MAVQADGELSLPDVGESPSYAAHQHPYLCSIMTQARFNHLMILHCHKESTDSLQLDTCLQEFVSGSEHRASVFGKFQ